MTKREKKKYQVRDVLKCYDRKYFEAGMLTVEEYCTMLGGATVKHDAESLRLKAEQKEREDQAARIEADRIKIANMEAELKAIEDKKKADTAIKEREIFKQIAIEDAMAIAEIMRVKSEEKRIALEIERIEFENIVHTEIAQAVKSDKDKLARCVILKDKTKVFHRFYLTNIIKKTSRIIND